MCGTCNRRAVVAGLTAALIALGLPGMLSAENIRIGVILSLTGNSASMGQSMREGIQLAVDEINKRSGVNGRKIEIDVQDSKGEPQAAIDAFNRIEATHPPLFYLSFLSNVGVALAPLADEKHVVLVGLMTSAAAFTSGHEWVFRFSPLVRADTAPLLILLQDLKVRRLGILYSNEEYGVEEQKLLSRGFLENGGSVAVQSFDLNDTDFRRQIDALKDREAIVVASLGPGSPAPSSRSGRPTTRVLSWCRRQAPIQPPWPARRCRAPTSRPRSFTTRRTFLPMKLETCIPRGTRSRSTTGPRPGTTLSSSSRSPRGDPAHEAGGEGRHAGRFPVFGSLRTGSPEVR